jgi:hypothetical protein
MQVKKAVVWWLVRNEDHPALQASDKEIATLMPMVTAMFPGINYYSISGFQMVMEMLVLPALRQRYPELRTTATRDVKAADMIEVAVVLPSDGYQWQDDARWMPRFRQAISA